MQMSEYRRKGINVWHRKLTTFVMGSNPKIRTFVSLFFLLVNPFLLLFSRFLRKSLYMTYINVSDI